MSDGIINNLMDIEKFKQVEADRINGLPIINDGRVVLRNKIDPDLEKNENNYSIEENIEEDSDEYLSELLEMLKTRTIVIGVGGAGNNAISRLQEIGLPGAITMAVNTDAQDLFYANADQKLLIGKKITQGLGAGNDPRVGEKSAEADLERIKTVVQKNIVFITCGLGGGTGTGAAPIIAREARKAGALVISLCTLPFKMEGEQKRVIAFKGLTRLAKYSDTIIPVPNEKLLKLVPNITVMKGFKIMDEILIRSVRSVVDLVSNCGLINLDLADVKGILSKTANSTGFIGMSEISIEKLKNSTDNLQNKDKMKEILKTRTIKALNNPLLDINPHSIQSCLVSIIGNQNLSLSQVNQIVGTVSSEIAAGAKLKFGAMIEPNTKSIKISIIGLGSKSPYLYQAEHITEDDPLKTRVEFIL